MYRLGFVIFLLASLILFTNDTVTTETLQIPEILYENYENIETGEIDNGSEITHLFSTDNLQNNESSVYPSEIISMIPNDTLEVSDTIHLYTPYDFD